MTADAHHILMPSGIPFPEFYQASMNWRTPVTGILMYLTVVYLWTIRVLKKQKQTDVSKKPSISCKTGNGVMTPFVFLHNLALAIYSGLTFYKMATGLHRTRTRDDVSMFVKVKCR